MGPDPKLAITSAIFLLGSCDISVSHKDKIQGCYYFNNQAIFKLENGKVFSNGSIISSYSKGKDEPGSYVIFEALRTVLDNENKINIVPFYDLNRNYITSIKEAGHIKLLIPKEPIGQTEAYRKDCTDG